MKEIKIYEAARFKSNDMYDHRRVGLKRYDLTPQDAHDLGGEDLHPEEEALRTDVLEREGFELDGNYFITRGTKIVKVKLG